MVMMLVGNKTDSDISRSVEKTTAAVSANVVQYIL